ncbi:hypothetical protein BaRGS_00037558 [Batillaria attramentaria]|uniref:Uncharacterized protein n=1 Tax=Batillaria attramentaria TaxID=370345 RepID=A0ABD0J8L9_9CAEN
MGVMYCTCIALALGVLVFVTGITGGASQGPTTPPVATAGQPVQTELLPMFLPTPTHVTVKQGALAILPCWVKNLGSREVSGKSAKILSR